MKRWPASDSSPEVLSDVMSWFSVTRERRESQRSLFRDDRGVIMVVGVFFTLLLIGLTWYVFGIGNAIAYRENLQNSADSAAFAAAVYDARGMNLLAMINIVMGVVLASLIVAKFIQIPIVLSDLETCEQSLESTEKVCTSLPPADFPCPVDVVETIATCTSKCNDIESWKKKLRSWDSGVHETLTVLHDAEVGIAVVWPWISAGKSGNIQHYYRDGFNLKNGAAVTSSFAYSQIPWNLDTNASIGSLISGDTGANKTTPDGPVRYGLPVTSDTYTDLCIAAFDDVATLGGVAPPNAISQIIGTILSVAGQWFCDDGAAAKWPTPLIEIVLPEIKPWGPQAAIFCAIENDLGALAKAIVSGNIGQGAASISPLPMSMTSPGVKSGNIEYSPMMLFGDAKMGLDYFGVWSTAIGDYDDTWTTQRLQVAGQQAKSGSKVVVGPPPDVYVGVAKSEFYYDPRSGDSQSSETKMTIKNQMTPTNVMWNMRWRARLRRYHYFPGADGLGDQLIDLMNQGFAAVATQAIQDLLAGKNPLTEFLDSQVSVKKLPSGGAPNIFH